MKYLCVKNWKKFQHDTTKALPWIKFFTALLAPTKEPWYSELPDATKALLHHIWLMASVFNNRIPEAWLTKEKLNLKSRLSLDPLLESGCIWFEDENGVILSSSCARDARSPLSISQSLRSPNQNQGDISGPERKTASEVPEDYALLPEDRQWAIDECGMTGADVDAETKRFVLHHRSKGNKFKRHGLAWRNWITGRFTNGGTRRTKHIRAVEPHAGDPERPSAKDLGMRTGADVLAELAAKR